jgi:hypothetical protein
MNRIKTNFFSRMLHKNQNERFGIIEVDREIKRINLQTRDIYEGIIIIQLNQFLYLFSICHII